MQDAVRTAQDGNPGPLHWNVQDVHKPEPKKA